MAKRIVIIGGGFAGVKCARILRKRLSPAEAEIVMFNRENHMVFHPLLAEVVGSSLSADDVAAPLREMLPGVRCRTEDVTDIDLDASEIVHSCDTGWCRRLAYDHVVISCGSVVNLSMVPGMADHAFPMKTVGDAIALRAHVMQQFERAECCDEAERRKFLLSFIIVGGGYSGVEAAGEINDLARQSRKFFHNIAPEEISVTVIHSRDQLLPEIGEELREFAREKMEKAGIKIMLNARVALATAEGVGLKDGTHVRGGTIVCTIGNMPAPMVQKLQSQKEGGRLATEPDMRLPGRTNAWALGDCASIVNALDGKPCPPTGQFAERQGRQAAENILRVMKGEATQPFSFKVLGQLCSIGGHQAVAEMFGMRASGFIAWFMWRGVYLFKLPSWSRRFKVGLDWAWELIFPRDLTHLRTDTTDRVTRAFLKPGDYVFHQGEPAASFYVIESGEAEVVREKPGEPEEVLAVLGAGSFFGEMALMSDKPRAASVRARTPLEVVVMGRNVFTQVSSALAPLKSLLTSAVSRRTKDFLQSLPAAREELSRVPVDEFMRPAPEPGLKLESTFEQALAAIDGKENDFCYVADESGALAGVVTRTDLFRALESGAARDTAVKQFMTADPVAVTKGDSALLAATTMRDRGLKWLPVLGDKEKRKVAGYVTAQSLVGRVLHGVPEKMAG